MIKSISILINNSRENIAFSSDLTSKVALNFDAFISNKIHSFDLEIVFTSTILSFRNHDYTWVDFSQERIANSFSPKVIQLENGYFVQANCNHGIWEINPKKPTVLLWRFNPEFAAPITKYCGFKNTKKIVSAEFSFDFQEHLALLITNENSVELSRSPIPFSAIACFTDHCDYDTSENLILQREFFKSNNIKTTKGFFLNHFSKRADNASYENDRLEIDQWEKEGHELCYHSLTQSIRKEEDAFYEFKNFIPPYPACKVWIDHGFQPYNFTLFENNAIPKSDYEAVLVTKNIEVLWNYIDAGTATIGILNQLNRNQFNLEQYSLSIKEKPFLKRMVLLIKNIIFHFDNDEFRVRNYIDALAHAKALVKKKHFFELFGFLNNIIPLGFMLLKVLFSWNRVKKSTYKVAHYSPLFFKHKIEEKEFYIFQTIEMVNFTKALCEKNIDELVHESGVFIAHTYFSVSMNHYDGKLINADNSLNTTVVANFNYLSKKIKEGAIWNPTLSELLAFYKDFQKTIFDIDEKGIIFIKNNCTIPSRTIQQ